MHACFQEVMVSGKDLQVVQISNFYIPNAKRKEGIPMIIINMGTQQQEWDTVYKLTIILQKIYENFQTFNFDLPKELLAEYPSENRDEARLMVVHRKTGEIEHKLFKDVIDYFDDGDVFVLNNTKVFPARLYGNKEKN